MTDRRSVGFDLQLCFNASRLCVEASLGLSSVGDCMLFPVCLGMKRGQPNKTQPFVTFNNTIAFPLLLLESLQSTGVLDSLLWGSGDTSSAALDRAKSYFLVNSMVSDSLTFSIGPWLLGVHEAEEDTPQVAYNPSNAGFGPVLSGGRVFESEEEDDVDTDMRSVYEEEEAAIAANEQTSLLPNKLVHTTTKIGHRSSHHSARYWQKMPGWVQATANLLLGVFNVPLMACIVGFVIGLVPQLQKAFFADQQEGGIFTAWLTKSVQHLGGLFATLQIVVVGVKLSNSLKNLKEGHERYGCFQTALVLSLTKP